MTMKEEDWIVKTVVRTVRCEDDVRKGIEKTLPADSRRRPFTDEDVEWLEENSWEFQEDRMLAITQHELLGSMLWFGACRYADRGKSMYMAFGAFPVTKTRLAFVSIGHEDKGVWSCARRILPALLNEHGKMEMKKNERD